MARLQIIDAHHHLWDPSGGGYPWMQSGVPKFMGDTSAVCHRYEVEDFRQEASTHGVDLIASVHLQCGRDPLEPAAESDWVQQQARRGAMPIAIIGYANLADPRLEELLDRHAVNPGFRGIRQMLNWGDDERVRLCDRGDYLADPAWQRGFARLGARGLSFDLQVNPWQLPQAARVAERHPDTAVVVNHAGLPFDHRGSGLATWQEGMRQMAANPSVHVKFSGLGMVDRGWSAASVRPLFEFLMEQFGVDRLMFASNFPMDRLYKTYGEVYGCYAELCAGMQPGAREALFHGTAARVYRIDTGAATQ